MRGIFFGVCLSLFAFSCSGESCDPIVLPGVSVVVTAGAVDGKCAAQVTASRGDLEVELMCPVHEQDCRCTGVDEVGVYEVSLRWGSRVETQNVEVTEDECHLITEDLIF